MITESEQALWRAAEDQTGRRGRAASWVTSDFNLLELWRIRHEFLIRPVAAESRHFGQAARLRAAGVILAERCALVDYMRQAGISGERRDRLILRLRGKDNLKRALLDEHRDYLLAVSSELCIDHLLGRIQDSAGPRLLKRYRALYVEHFKSVCAQQQDGDTGSDEGRTELPPAISDLRSLLSARRG